MPLPATRSKSDPDLNRHRRDFKSRAGRRQHSQADMLRAARSVLVTVGYARLTMRAVAREADISVGNLAYHFPSKRRLVRELIHSLVAEYQSKSNEYLKDDRSRGRGFSGLVRWLVADSVSAETGRLFREFWVIALHDKVIAAELDNFYAQAHKTIVALLRRSKPGLNVRSAYDLVQIMGSVSEGLNVLYLTVNSRRRMSIQRVSKLAAELLSAAADDLAGLPGSN